MAISDYSLSAPPDNPRKMELWLQHAAGFILFQDMRDYAIQQIAPGLSDDAQTAARKGIDDAVYGLMMILDGVTGGLTNQRHRVDLRVIVELTDYDSRKEIAAVDLADGEGMCMGYHGWRHGDFGEVPLVDSD